jgi:glycosyltransferase involved in cell wall biosynthesis
VPAHKVHVVPHGIHTHFYEHHGYASYAARKALGLPTNAVLLGLIGRLDRQKRQDFAIRALAHSPDQVHLAIMGAKTQDDAPNSYQEEMLELIRSHKLDGRVHFMPFADDVRMFYAAVDIVLMTTHRETYGLVTVEALAAGKPVLGNNSGGTAAILEQGAYGYLYENEDIAGFVQKVQHICTHLPEAQAKAALGQAHVAEHRSKEQMLRKFKEIVLK